MIFVIFALSIVTAFAGNDPYQGKYYSYSETGNCTVAYGAEIYYSSAYLSTRRFTVNGNIATCAWAVNQTPEAKTYINATKYYLAGGIARAKAFYWLLINPNATIPSSDAKYNSSSTTFAQDLAYATNAAQSGSTQTYAFAHCVIDYLQQGQVNAYGGSAWNNVVKNFAAKAANYPNVPSAYKIYYFYPSGNNRQSLMSYDSPGYIQITKRSLHPTYTQNNSNYSLVGAVFTVYSNQACTNAVTTITCNSSVYLDEAVTLVSTGEALTQKLCSRGKSGAIAAGTYYLKETTAPKGYELNTDVFSVTVTAGATAVKMTNLSTGATVGSVSDETCFGSAQITKISSDPSVTNNNSNYSLSGAVYGIYYDAACLRRYRTMTTDADGIATAANLIARDYYVKEISAPRGYKLDTTVYPLSVAVNETATLTLSDDPSFTPPPPEGYIHLSKSSALPNISQGNTIYSLEGAVYGVYTDSACTSLADELITDTDGEATSLPLAVGDYYVKEITAPEGYKADTAVYPVSVPDTTSLYLFVDDVPYSQTFDILLQKVATSNGDTPGYTDVSDAEYAVNYYDAFLYTEEEIENAAPFRSWVLGTDVNGHIALDNAHLISGGAFFLNEHGDHVIPLGTITIREISAPPGLYLDETLYIRQITEASAANLIQYNTPVSYESVIERIEITGTKIWDDDNNSDGRRPESITVELYRDNELFDTATASAASGWTYSFSDLPKAYADLTLPEYYHIYAYDVIEVAVDGYTGSTDGMEEDPDDENHLICDFTNHYTPALISVSGSKTWSDFNNVMGRRPDSITVILYRDSVQFQTKTVTAADNWQFTFDDLPLYHDGGREYVYTVGESGVNGYDASINGTVITNTMKTGRLTIHKTDASGRPISGVTFRVLSKDVVNDGVVSVLTNGRYVFKGFSNVSGGTKVYTTNAAGNIVINDLPYGNYQVVETGTPAGNMIYDQPIEITVNALNADRNVEVSVVNAKAVMPETGGTGTLAFYILSTLLAGIAFMILRKTILNELTRKDC